MSTVSSSAGAPSYRESSAPSYQEVIAADARPAPEIFREYSELTIDCDRAPRSQYTCPDFAKRELERMWPKVWQVACREEEIPEVGDYFVYESPGASIIIVRTESNEIKAFYNSCRHRGMKLCFGASNLPKFTCPFHGFQWALDGSLAHVPAKWDFEHIDGEDMSLLSVKADTWGGFVFVNRDPGCAPLYTFLGHLVDHFEDWPRDEVYLAAKITKDVDANWKTCIEAFVESFHVPGIHPQAVRFGGDSSTQYDVWPDDANVSRFLEATGFASDQLPAISEQEILASALQTMMGDQADVPRVEPGQRARDVMVAAARAQAETVYGQDYSHLSDTEALDPIQYSLFPNFVLFRSLGYPYAYRFLPNGDDPNRAVFDFFIFAPKPDDGSELPEATLVELGPEDTYRDSGVLPPWLGDIYDQDTVGLAQCQDGMRNGGDADIIYSNYQEVRIRHLHQTLMSYLED